MAEDRNFTLKIITPERIFYEGPVSMVEFNTTEGAIGIYKGHIPMTVMIKPAFSRSRLKRAGGKPRCMQVLWRFCRIR